MAPPLGGLQVNIFTSYSALLTDRGFTLIEADCVLIQARELLVGQSFQLVESAVVLVKSLVVRVEPAVLLIKSLVYDIESPVVPVKPLVERRELTVVRFKVALVPFESGFNPVEPLVVTVQTQVDLRKPVLDQRPQFAVSVLSMAQAVEDTRALVWVKAKGGALEIRDR